MNRAAAFSTNWRRWMRLAGIVQTGRSYNSPIEKRRV